jgi:hypothetical protein
MRTPIFLAATAGLSRELFSGHTARRGIVGNVAQRRARRGCFAQPSRKRSAFDHSRAPDDRSCADAMRRRNNSLTVLLPINALPGSEIAPHLGGSAAPGTEQSGCSIGRNDSLLRRTCRACLWPAGSPMTRSSPIVPAATINFRKDIVPFTQALMLKTSPDRFDHGPGAPAGCAGAHMTLFARVRSLKRQHASQVAGFAAVAIAAAALISWWVAPPMLSSWGSGFATMRPMTALCLTSLGLALVYPGAREREPDMTAIPRQSASPAGTRSPR